MGGAFAGAGTVEVARFQVMTLPNAEMMRVELGNFEKTNLYKHLQQRRSEMFESRVKSLIDAALQSGDMRVCRIAQSIRQDSMFWSEIDQIKNYRGDDRAPIVDTGPLKQFPDFDRLDDIEVGSGGF
jgi:hypothetical protein